MVQKWLQDELDVHFGAGNRVSFGLTAVVLMTQWIWPNDFLWGSADFADVSLALVLGTMKNKFINDNNGMIFKFSLASVELISKQPHTPLFWWCFLLLLSNTKLWLLALRRLRKWCMRDLESFLMSFSVVLQLRSMFSSLLPLWPVKATNIPYISLMLFFLLMELYFSYRSNYCSSNKGLVLGTWHHTDCCNCGCVHICWRTWGNILRFIL